jgi:hypothetical protein
MSILLPAIVSRLLQTLVALLNADLIGIWRRLGERILTPRCEGLYEVLDYEARLELGDPGG